MYSKRMNCRSHCGACCIAPSIQLPMPNMPNGKPAGEMCANLDPLDFSCRIWDQSDYPKHCTQFIATEDVCGQDREHASYLISRMEKETLPD